MKEAALSINRNFKTFWNAVENKLKCSDSFWTKVKYDKLDLSKMYNYEDTRKCPVFQYDNLGNYECCYEKVFFCIKFEQLLFSYYCRNF